KRQDWTKDVFSQTTHHECKLTIKKEPNSDIVIYHTETTAPETKSFMTELQTVIHNHFRQQGDISKNTPIQKVFAHHFVENKYRFEFLRKFTQPVSTLSFQKIVDLDAGIDHQFSDFPEKFKWLKNKIDKINLHGTKLGETDIMILSEEGVFIFGEIEAEFRFDYSEAKGTCIIRYGFPNYYEKAKLVEFEARVASLQLHASYSHIAKKRVANFVLQEFQREKHKYFEQFKTVGKVDTRTRDLQNQYMFEGEGWD
ncbi:MAG: hypothetical protein H6633_09020, partial [Anaerolineales bacterium]|nr:hypothetical protein [Anaerolineales bacterium]